MFLHRGFSFWYLFAILADSTNHHINLGRDKILWELHRWYRHIFKANCIATIVANKMHMVILVLAFVAIVLTQRIENGIISGGYIMYNPLFQKYL